MAAWSEFRTGGRDGTGRAALRAAGRRLAPPSEGAAASLRSTALASGSWPLGPMFKNIFHRYSCAAKLFYYLWTSRHVWSDKWKTAFEERNRPTQILKSVEPNLEQNDQENATVSYQSTKHRNIIHGRNIQGNLKLSEEWYRPKCAGIRSISNIEKYEAGSIPSGRI